jgi:photosystem II stability/assembly factor-like uncharacterized protein
MRWVGTFLLLALFPPFCPSQGAWIKQKSGTLAWLHAICFVDRNTGWTAGASGTLLATHDGGLTWQQLPKPSEDSILVILFADESNGWLLCDRDEFKLSSNDEARNYLLRTDNGGRTWRRITISGNDTHATLVRMIFSQSDQIWLLGEMGTIFKSVDGGENWKRQPFVTRYVLRAGDFLSADQGWLVGAGATVIQTSDSGGSWHGGLFDKAAARLKLNAVSFADRNFGWVVGGEGRIYATLDGGRTWMPQNSTVAVELRDVKFLDASEGWVAGDDGTLLHTTDGGTHWVPEASGTTHFLERLYVASPDSAWAVGFGGTILKFDPSAASVHPKIR